MKHNYFRSGDCMDNPFPKLFADSKVAARYLSARTTSRAVIRGVTGHVKDAIADMKNVANGENKNQP